MTEKTEAVEAPEDEGRDRGFGLMEAYYLGTRTQYLASCVPARESITVHSPGGGDLVDSLRFLLDRSGALHSSEHLERETRDFVDHLLSEYDEGDNPDPDDAQKAAELSSRWAEAFSDIEDEQGIIHVIEPGFMDLNRAMRTPEDFFGQEVWDWLDDESKRDLREAVRALAADCPTASVMVSLRAVERQLRVWHNDRSDEDIDLGPWGHVLGELADLYDDHQQDRPEVLTDLSYMKDRRNEVNHMETSPTPKQAEINLRRVQATLENIHAEIENEGLTYED